MHSHYTKIYLSISNRYPGIRLAVANYDNKGYEIFIGQFGERESDTLLFPN